MVLPYGSSRKFSPRYSTSHAGDSVVAVAKVLLLRPVAGTVSGVEVEDDLVGGMRLGVRWRFWRRRTGWVAAVRWCFPAWGKRLGNTAM